MKEKDNIDVDTLLSIFTAEYSSPLTHYVEKGMSLADVSKMMDKFQIRHVPVFEGKKPIGIISNNDINMVKGIKNSAALKVEDFMVKDPYVVSGGEDFDKVIEAMNENKYSCVLVELSSQQSPIGYGILTTVDIINAFVSILRGDLPEKIAAFDEMDYHPAEDISLSDLDIPKEDVQTNLFPEV